MCRTRRLAFSTGGSGNAGGKKGDSGGILVVPSLRGASRLRWLDGEQAAELKMLDHGELLQTLQTEQRNEMKEERVTARRISFRKRF